LIHDKAKLKLDCSYVPGLPNFNAFDKSEGPRFVDSEASFAQYDPALAGYIKDVLKSIPLKIDAIDVIFGDNFIVLTPSVDNQWRPDCYRNPDGATYVEQAWPVSSLVQPHDQVWRNFILNEKGKRLITVDRFVKQGRHFAIVQIYQSENKKIPWSNSIVDVTSKRNIQNVGMNLDHWFNRWVNAWENDYEASYNDCIRRADSCYMRGDYAGASKAFEVAFRSGNEVQGQHLYNSACAAALAGLTDVAFERLNLRLKQDHDWYVDDPNRDQDLANLHNDTRWQTYCDTIFARRKRIEADYDQPLRQQLLEIGRRDQGVRHEFLSAYNTQPRNQALIDSLTREMHRVDSVNETEICSILETRGFVGRDLVGDACNVFWMVIQHAPLELEKKYFPMFAEAMQHGDIPKSNVALMDDRIAMFEGRPQKYGTQFEENGQGQWVLYQLLDSSQVDIWRQEMGLGPLADDLKRMGVER